MSRRKPAEEAETAASSQGTTALERPKGGGSYVRQPDGSLVRQEAETVEQQEAESTAQSDQEQEA